MRHPAPSPRISPPPVAEAWYRRTSVVAVVAALAGLAAGAVGATMVSDPTSSTEYQALQRERDDTSSRLLQAQSDLQASQADLQDARSRLGDAQDRMTRLIADLPAREAAVEKAEAKVKKGEAAVAKREAAVEKAKQEVAAREKAVTLVETTLADNTIAGDGVYAVGPDIKAGTYQTAGRKGCSYAVLTAGATSGVVHSTIVDGPAIVTVLAGQSLKLKGCADWVWQG